ncbi:MAG TPA: hypothetical protein VH120_20855, partial [Gemmataceae bacterium]|nr:hypothetical protein [Gemmataceae bacterium]
AWRDFNVPLLAGRDVAKMYELTVPSRVIVLDADGVVRFLGDAGPGVIDAVQRVVAPVSGN